jgi:hypothetical protein
MEGDERQQKNLKLIMDFLIKLNKKAINNIFRELYIELYPDFNQNITTSVQIQTSDYKYKEYKSISLINSETEYSILEIQAPNGYYYLIDVEDGYNITVLKSDDIDTLLSIVRKYKIGNIK